MTALALAIGSLVALAVILGLEFRRRDHARTRIRIVTIDNRPRRQPHVEDRVHDAIAETKHRFGDVFASYRVWRYDRETRLELRAAPPWRKLSEFTRSIILRHLWRALEAVATGSVVVVDAPAQSWSAEINAKFFDRGIDPWKASPLYAPVTAPQYFK